ncbi:hypothetical protein NMY22_g16700 [Coprinellus aureogranulatus]|nr:hypothetical protein NMY22_g16700 [Coprinellus aureogranulatus]
MGNLYLTSAVSEPQQNDHGVAHAEIGCAEVVKSTSELVVLKVNLVVKDLAAPDGGDSKPPEAMTDDDTSS